jgi:hypothetical protein
MTYRQKLETMKGGYNMPKNPWIEKCAELEKTLDRYKGEIERHREEIIRLKSITEMAAVILGKVKEGE